jgi:hypothetical protein
LPAIRPRYPQDLIMYPRILLHSDLHLDSGPFTLPTPEDGPAVAVFAGDVLPGAESVAAVARITPLPAVMVGGNHEFYGGDYFEVLAQLRAAQVPNVAFLENRAVVLEGVRFLGATLWTDYGGGDRALMDYGLWHMNDHRCIKAARWWSAANKARFLATFGQHALERFEGNFNPLLARELHTRSVAWLRSALHKPFAGPTFIVTHHAPTFTSLLKSGRVSEHALRKSSWQRRMNDDLNLTVVGSYASDVLTRLERELAGADVRGWGHGHLHAALAFGEHGVPVLCNPRGRVHPPLTEKSAQTYRLFGASVTTEDIARSQAYAREFPEEGDGRDYDRTLAVPLDESGYRLVAEAHAEATEKLAELRAEVRTLRGLSRSRRAAVADLAAHRADTLRLQAVEILKTFATELLNQLGSPHQSHVLRMGLGYLLSACKLVEGRGIPGNALAGVENVACYDSLMRWREHVAQDEKERERYSAANHVKHVAHTLTRIGDTLLQTPRACDRLKMERARFRDVLRR